MLQVQGMIRGQFFNVTEQCDNLFQDVAAECKELAWEKAAHIERSLLEVQLDVMSLNQEKEAKAAEEKAIAIKDKTEKVTTE